MVNKVLQDARIRLLIGKLLERSDRVCPSISSLVGTLARQPGRGVEVSRFPMMYLRAASPTDVRSWPNHSLYTLQSSRDSIPNMPLSTTSTSFTYHKCMSCRGTLPPAMPK